jgi:Fur family transcriptional regulator, peroxide stress response regulator
MFKTDAGLLATQLRQAGFRVTAPRLAILAEVSANRTHPGASELHQSLKRAHPSLSVSTIYLTLEAFARKGLVHRMPARDGRLRVDGQSEPHDHAVCRGCGEVYDLPTGLPGSTPSPAGLPKGLRVLGARIEYDVVCTACQTGRRTGTQRRTRRLPGTRASRHAEQGR